MRDFQYYVLVTLTEIHHFEHIRMENVYHLVIFLALSFHTQKHYVPTFKCKPDDVV